MDVFNRYEKKYAINDEQFARIQEHLQAHMALDPYNKANGFYTISNIYYDTEDDYLIKRSLSKPVFKEKLRLRAYGVPSKEDNVYLEIKKKYKGRGNKRRTTINLSDACTFINDSILPPEQSYQNPLVMDEIAYFLKRYCLRPKVYIAYDRIAYAADDVRITLDFNIRYRRDRLELNIGDDTTPLLPSGHHLMEIKVLNNMPHWLSNLLAQEQLYPTSFSKYGKVFELTQQPQTAGAMKINNANPNLRQTNNQETPIIQGGLQVC